MKVCSLILPQLLWFIAPHTHMCIGKTMMRETQHLFLALIRFVYLHWADANAFFRFYSSSSYILFNSNMCMNCIEKRTLTSVLIDFYEIHVNSISVELSNNKNCELFFSSSLLLLWIVSPSLFISYCVMIFFLSSLFVDFFAIILLCVVFFSF